MIRTKLNASGTSFMLSKGKRAPISLCTTTRGRMEAKYLTKNWAESGNVEVVVVEIGPKPTVFDESSLVWVDIYVFLEYPNDAPFANCWWKNIAVRYANGAYLAEIDCDFALEPGIFSKLLPILPKGGLIWPSHCTLTETNPSGKPYNKLLPSGIRGNYEGFLLWHRDTRRLCGDWPEWYTGRSGHIALLRQKWEELDIPIIRHIDPGLMKHVPHQSVLLCRNDLSRLQISPYKHNNNWSWDPVTKRLPLPGEVYWPLPEWEVGDVTLYERYLETRKEQPKESYPPISILMPLKRSEPEYLKQALRSVLFQTCPDWELLVLCNDLSPDMLPILNQLDDPRVRVVNCSSTPGICAALNQGMRLATGKFACSLMADDALEMNAIEVVQRYIKANPDIDFFHSARREINGLGEAVRGLPIKSWEAKDFWTRNPVQHLMCWNRELAIQLGGMDEKLGLIAADDLDFSWSMFEGGMKFKAIPDFLYIHRRHPFPRLSTHVPLSSQQDQLRIILRKHKVPEDIIESQIKIRTEAYLAKEVMFNG